MFSYPPIPVWDAHSGALKEGTGRKPPGNLRDPADRTRVIAARRCAALPICDRVMSFAEDGAEDALG